MFFSGEKRTKLVRTEDGRFRRMAVFDDESEEEGFDSDDSDDDDDSNGVGPSSQFLDPVSTLKDIQCEYISSYSNTYPAHRQGEARKPGLQYHMGQAEMPTIPIFAESFRFSRLISALRFRTSKFRKITILQGKMVPDKMKDVTPTYAPFLRTFYVAVDSYT